MGAWPVEGADSGSETGPSCGLRLGCPPGRPTEALLLRQGAWPQFHKSTAAV